MKIYTKTGDRGETSLFGGIRISKSSLQVEAYGSVDELTSFIGLVIAKLKNEKEKVFLSKIQKELYQIMASLSGADNDLKNLKISVLEFEKKIDALDRKLPKLNRFILPQGTELSGWFHILRTVCRRTERNTVKLLGKKILKSYHPKVLKSIIQYLNRLSDLFFMLARWYGKGEEIST